MLGIMGPSWRELQATAMPISSLYHPIQIALYNHPSGKTQTPPLNTRTAHVTFSGEHIGWKLLLPLSLENTICHRSTVWTSCGLNLLMGPPQSCGCLVTELLALSPCEADHILVKALESYCLYSKPNSAQLFQNRKSNRTYLTGLLWRSIWVRLTHSEQAIIFITCYMYCFFWWRENYSGSW